MAVLPPDERLTRLEQIVQIIAEDHLSQKEDHDSMKEDLVSLNHLIADLATETRRGFDQVAAQFRETDARIDKLFRETDARFRETDARIDRVAHEGAERARASDERVDRLVLAIGELISRQDAGAKQ